MKALLVFAIVTRLVISCSAHTDHQYCIIGAGPSGLQLGYFLQRAGRDYVIIKKAAVAGSFYLHYPRHRTLISINKRFTGSTNKEFNFRHDWNSLISADESLQVRHYSKDYFPPADSYVTYLQDFAKKLKLNIQYNSEIVSVAREKSDGPTAGKFVLEDRNGTSYHCDIVVVSTGMWKPNIPKGFPGIEHAEGYESVSVNPEDFEGQTVLIIGKREFRI
ncbi:FAD-dependent oxidoreductase domain-containing protein 2-like [Dysidea avara]|uniref:FAD-dependent oxidoreductase domain-containing protein 2-like n=1 Tax=Dysidea avara TaxID=196820 RepID=UPI00331BC88A